jgi:chromosome segregation ATPase
MKHPLFISTLIFMCALAQVRAEDLSPTELRLRESLKGIAVRLRAAETDRANLQAAQAQSEITVKQQAEEIEALKKQLSKAAKQAAADQDAARKAIDGLTAKLEVRENENVQYQKALEKWKEGFNKAAAIARAKETERARAASSVIVLEQKLADRERKNVELFEIGSEILERYKNFGLGKALLAREPFTGTTTVKLQTLVQDYADKLQDSKFSPFHDDATKAGTAKSTAAAQPPPAARP